MRKILKTIWMLVLLVPAMMQAQTTVVVAEGTASPNVPPFYLNNAKYAQWSQSIYPAAELTELVGQKLAAFTYHTSISTFTPDPGEWTIMLGITTKNNLAYGKDNTACTTVFEGRPTFDISTGNMTFTFDTPFEYNGGNLLVWFDHPAGTTTAANACTWQAKVATDASRRAYNSGYTSQYNTEGSLAAYLPTIWVTTAPSAQEPEAVPVSLNNYIFSPTQEDYVPLSQRGGTEWSADEQTAGIVAIDMPFDFPFGTQAIAQGTQLYVSASKGLALTQSGYIFAPMSLIADGAAYTGFGDNTILTYITSDSVVVEWNALQHGTGTSANTYTFQLVLEANGNITFHYNNCVVNSYKEIVQGIYCSTAENTCLNGYSYADPSRNHAGLSTRSISTSSKPRDGQVYRFTRPDCHVIAVSSSEPWVEEFNDTWVDNRLPGACWESVQSHNGSSTNNHWNRSYSDHAGSGYGAYMSGTYSWNGSWNAIDLITPVFDIPEAGAYTVGFWMKRGTGSTVNARTGVRLFASTSTDTADGQMLLFAPYFTTVNPTVAEAGWYYFEATIPMSGHLYFIFRGLDYSNTRLDIDGIRVAAVPSCDNPDDLAWDAANQLVTWTAGNATQWQVRDGDTYSIVSTPSYTNSAWLSATTYNIYVRSICGAGDTLEWRGPLSFTTPCDLLVLGTDDSLVFNFDNLTTSGTIPACWTVNHISGPGSQLWGSYSVTGAHSGNRVMRLPDMNATTITNLVTSQINIPAAGSHEVRLWIMRGNGTKQHEGVKVWANATPDTIGGTPLFHARRCITAEPVVSSDGWYEYRGTIPMAGNLYIVLQGISEYGQEIRIDDLVIAPATATPAEADDPADAIQYWVGTGENSATFTLHFNNAATPTSFVWGYRWDDPYDDYTVGMMMEEIAQADSRVTFDGLEHGFLTYYTYNDGTYNLTAPTGSNYAGLIVNDEVANYGANAQPLADGDAIAWLDADYGFFTGDINLGQTDTVYVTNPGGGDQPGTDTPDDPDDPDDPVDPVVDTLCSTVYTLPYTIDFSGYTLSPGSRGYEAAAPLPDCWSVLGNGRFTAGYDTTASASIYFSGIGTSNSTNNYGCVTPGDPYFTFVAYGGYDGTYATYVDNVAKYGTRKYAILPTFDHPLSEVVLTFDHRTSARTGAELRVGYIVDDTASFVAIDTFVTDFRILHHDTIDYSAHSAAIPANARMAMLWLSTEVIHMGDAPGNYFCGIDNLKVELASTSDTPDPVADATIAASDILYWVGSGSDSAIFVISDGVNTRAWGYLFDEDDAPTALTMASAIDAADPRLAYSVDWTTYEMGFVYREYPVSFSIADTRFKVDGVLADAGDELSDVDVENGMVVMVCSSTAAVWSAPIVPATVKHMPRNSTIAASDILYWVGAGANEAVVAVNWGVPDTALAWGVRFDGTLTIGGAIDAIANADPRVSTDAARSTINFSDGTVSLSFQPAPVSYMQFIIGNNSNVNVNSPLANGDQLKIGESAYGEGYDSTEYGGMWFPMGVVWSTEIHPVSDPNDTPDTPSLVDATVNFADITCWAGSGPDSTALIVSFANPDTAFAWGVLINAQTTGEAMLNAVLAVDTNLSITGHPDWGDGQIRYRLSDGTVISRTGSEWIFNIDGVDSWGDDLVWAGSVFKFGDRASGILTGESAFQRVWTAVPTIVDFCLDEPAPAVEDATIAASDILYWVGSGSNQVVMAVNWADTALAWGFRFNDAVTTATVMMDSIAAADPRFSYIMGMWGVGDIRYIDTAAGMTDTLGIAPGNYWWSLLNGQGAMGMGTPLHDGDFFKWGDLSSATVTDSVMGEYGMEYSYVWTRTIVPVSVPDTVGNSPAPGPGPNPGHGPFCGAVGTEGCNAIAADSSAIVAWATGVVIERGPQMLGGNPDSLATHGSDTSALGPATLNTLAAISLGDGGTATLTFDRPIANGDGPDFAVFENSFSDNFLELAFVEVSSDGQHFVRFPATSLTQTETQTSGIGSTDPTFINNLAGKFRIGYGTPFDLEELRDSVGINIDSITHVRIVDVVGSIDPRYATYDAFGHIVNDPWPTNFGSGGFDLTGVGVIHQADLPTTGIRDAELLVEALWPNPTADRVTVSLARPAVAQLFDLSGRSVATYDLGQGRNVLDLGDLPAGVYMLRAEGSVSKIVKR